MHADSASPSEVLEFGELTIDVSGHKVLVSGEEIDLHCQRVRCSPRCPATRGRVYSRMELVEKVLGYDFEGYERTIDPHVKNLRAKIGDNPRNPKWLTPCTAWATASRSPPRTASSRPFASLLPERRRPRPLPLRRSSMTETEANLRLLDPLKAVAHCRRALASSSERKKDTCAGRTSPSSRTLTALVAMSLWFLYVGTALPHLHGRQHAATAETTANRIAAIYEETGDLGTPRPRAWPPRPPSSRAVGVRVIDLKGSTVFDSSVIIDEQQGRCVQVLAPSRIPAGGQGL